MSALGLCCGAGASVASCGVDLRIEAIAQPGSCCLGWLGLETCGGVNIW